MEKSVSVIMPVCDETAYLYEAVDSIMTQTYENIELIIVDSSKDRNKVKSIIADFCGNIKYFYQEKSGIYSALNYAIGKATGDYIARMDADDVSLPDRINAQVAYMEGNRNVEVLATRYERIDENGNFILSDKGMMDHERIMVNLIFDNPIIHPSVMFRRSVFEAGWRYENAYAEDLDLWARMAKTVYIDTLNQKLLLYRVHGNNSVLADVNKVIESSTKSTYDYIKIMFDVDMDKYKSEDFIKNYYLYTLRGKFTVDLDLYIQRQFCLLNEIYSVNQMKNLTDEELLCDELDKRWSIVTKLLPYVRDEAEDEFNGETTDDNGLLYSKFTEIRKSGTFDKDMTIKSLNNALTVKRNKFNEFIGSNRRFLLYGLGEVGKKTLEYLKHLATCGKLKWELAGIIDRKSIVYTWRGSERETIGINDLLTMNFDYIVISSDDYYEEIRDSLLATGVPDERILNNIYIYIYRKDADV